MCTDIIIPKKEIDVIPETLSSDSCVAIQSFVNDFFIYQQFFISEKRNINTS